jgi:hypothetical protein
MFEGADRLSSNGMPGIAATRSISLIMAKLSNSEALRSGIWGTKSVWAAFTTSSAERLLAARQRTGGQPQRLL